MYQLPAELVINSVSELKETLLDLLSKQSSIELDISQVTRADTASIQLLCSLQKI
jgi:anti-anti-sigma regulatory factor